MEKRHSLKCSFCENDLQTPGQRIRCDKCGLFLIKKVPMFGPIVVEWVQDDLAYTLICLKTGFSITLRLPQPGLSDIKENFTKDEQGFRLQNNHLTLEQVLSQGWLL